MRRVAVAWVLCSLAGSATAQETPNPLPAPTPSAQPQGDAGRDKTPAQPQSTPPAPIIVNVQPSPRTEAEAQKEEHERQEKANLDRRLVELTGDLADYTRWLAYATFALFAVTAGLFAFAIKQAFDAKEVGRAARDSAEAARKSAELSEKALLSGETPYLHPILSVTPKGGKLEVDGQIFINDLCVCAFENYGNMAAIMYGARIQFEEGPGLPDTVFPFEHKAFFRMNKIIRNGERSEPMRLGFDGHFYDRPMTVDDMKSHKMTFMTGAVWYSDFLGNHFLTRFCYGFSNYSHEAVLLGGEKHNHRRRLTEAELASLKDRTA